MTSQETRAIDPEALSKSLVFLERIKTRFVYASNLHAALKNRPYKSTPQMLILKYLLGLSASHNRPLFDEISIRSSCIEAAKELGFSKLLIDFPLLNPSKKQADLLPQEEKVLKLARGGVHGAILAAHAIGIEEFPFLSQKQLAAKAADLRIETVRAYGKEVQIKETPWPWTLASKHMSAVFHLTGVRINPLNAVEIRKVTQEIAQHGMHLERL